LAGLRAARSNGHTDEAVLSMAKDAGLIHDILPRIAQDAERILEEGAARVVVPDPLQQTGGHR